MAKIRRCLEVRADGDKETILNITVDVDVNSQGFFTTTLKPEDAKLIESYGIELVKNRAGNPGFFIDRTLDGIISQIREVMRAAVGYNIVAENPVIMYYIDTYCSYCISKEGEICPNGTFEYLHTQDYHWKTGTIQIDGSTKLNDFGLKFYARPCMKKEIVYGNGVHKFQYDYGHEWEKGSYMKWLDDVPTMKPMFGHSGIKEIEGTEDNAKFFVNLIKSICKLNENIGEFLKQDRLDLLIQKTLQLENITK